MKLKISNISQVDIVIDVNGKGNPEDKIILHPATTESVEIEDSQFQKIKKTQGIVCQPIRGV